MKRGSLYLVVVVFLADFEIVPKQLCLRVVAQTQVFQVFKQIILVL